MISNFRLRSFFFKKKGGQKIKKRGVRNIKKNQKKGGQKIGGGSTPNSDREAIAIVGEISIPK
jgi:hypothetical protein